MLDGMLQSRCNVSQRLEYKSTFMHPWMWYQERLAVEDYSVEEQDVQVYRAIVITAVDRLLSASQLSLDLL